MNFLIKCPKCGATCWVPGSVEHDETGMTWAVQGVFLDEDAPREWEGGDPACEHDEENAETIDSEYPEPLEDDVI